MLRGVAFAVLLLLLLRVVVEEGDSKVGNQNAHSLPPCYIPRGVQEQVLELHVVVNDAVAV
jgi:hypothetical protein